jgi:hypothetical protein
MVFVPPSRSNSRSARPAATTRAQDVTDLIEEHGLFVGKHELSRLAAGRAGKSAFLVTKQFALEKVLRNRRAVDLDERPRGPPRFFMDGACHQVFADTAFAAQQHRRIGRRHPLHGGQDFLHLYTARYQVGMLVALLQRFAQRPVLYSQALHIQLLVHHHTHFVQRKRL